MACQTNAINCILHQPILSGKLGKWAYSLIDYDLTYEPLKST
jgi:hypothetical protein